MEQDHIRRIYESFQKRADPEEYLLVRLQNLLEKAIHRVPEDVTSEAFSNFDGDFKGCLVSLFILVYFHHFTSFILENRRVPVGHYISQGFAICCRALEA